MNLPTPVTCVCCYGSGQQDLTAVIERMRGRSHVTANGCWQYGAGQGLYPKVLVGYLTIPVHQLAFWAVHGTMPSMVTHTCDNTRCWNPDHLVAGTALSNNRDRRTRAKTYGRAGAKNHFARLTAEAVADIRERVGEDGVLRNAAARELAATYGVSSATIRRAAYGLTWSQDTREKPAPRAHWRERGITPVFPDRTGGSK